MLDLVFNNNTFILKTTIMSALIHDKTALIGKLKNDKKAGKLSNKDSIDIEAIIENVDIQQVTSSKDSTKSNS